MIEDVPPKRLRAKQNIVTPAFAGFIVRKCQIEGLRLYRSKLLEVLVMIRLLWLSTKVPFLVYGKPQKQSIPITQSIQTEFHASKAHTEGKFVGRLDNQNVCRLPSGFCLWFACYSASWISQISFWNW